MASVAFWNEFPFFNFLSILAKYGSVLLKGGSLYGFDSHTNSSWFQTRAQNTEYSW
jgi:hypothetical protein